MTRFSKVSFFAKMSAIAMTGLLVSGLSVAQSASKIGFVDPVRLIEQAPQGVTALAALEEETMEVVSSGVGLERSQGRRGTWAML